MKKKRIFDLTLLFLISPLVLSILIIITILNFFINGRPIFFMQKRIGYLNKTFIIYKFRSMPKNLDHNYNIKSLSRWNKFLRSSSLDEIPEFYNILKGDMSFVGPRPLLTEYLNLYSKKNLRRHDVLPGITGLAQINGRNAISWKEKFFHDIEYIENNNIYIDLKIIFLTILKIFNYKYINSSKDVSMEKFNENTEQ
jgi:undecaprenyl phosphate N,N'-diacetylbacillosamine 1-phosphate transferase